MKVIVRHGSRGMSMCPIFTNLVWNGGDCVLACLLLGTAHCVQSPLCRWFPKMIRIAVLQNPIGKTQGTVHEL